MNVVLIETYIIVGGGQSQKSSEELLEVEWVVGVWAKRAGMQSRKSDNIGHSKKNESWIHVASNDLYHCKAVAVVCYMTCTVKQVQL